MKNLDNIILSADRKTAFIQPGNNWGRIYGELTNYDLSVIGGRVTPIGIGGLTTGGGISFFSNIHGFACDNVASYEVVTSTGDLVTASPSQNSDLYWALRGGGNNFGIVVNFELETIPVPGGEMWGSTRVYMEDQFPNLIDAFAGLIDDSPDDPNAGTWVAWILNSGAKLASAELWYAKPDGQNASIFENYNRIPTISDISGNKTLTNYTAQVASRNPYGYRECYSAISTRASRAVAQAATDIFFDEVVAVSDVPGANPVMVWQGITEGVSKIPYSVRNTWCHSPTQLGNTDGFPAQGCSRPRRKAVATHLAFQWKTGPSTSFNFHVGGRMKKTMQECTR